MTLDLAISKSVTAAPRRPTPRAREVAAMFGLGLDERASFTIIPSTHIQLSFPSLVFVTGPSGTGKSTILSEMKRAARDAGHRVIDLHDLPPTSHLPLIDQLGKDSARGAELLSHAGLAEALLMLRAPEELSDGQRWRFSLARLFELADSDCPSGAIILVDEFAATLDRVTARNLAHNVRRWVSRSSYILIAASSHDDLIEPLAPDVVIRKGFGADIAVTYHDKKADNTSAFTDDIIIEPGTLADYRALSAFHYRSGHPGAVTNVLRAVVKNSRADNGKERVGVLVRSLPALLCQLRNVATAGRYAGLSRSEAAMMLNREVRTISRVIIDPRFRGRGIAVQLVRYAIAHPQPGVIYTEALAAMGRVCPFFEKAGMMRYERTVRARADHARLLDVFESLGCDVTSLAGPEDSRAFLDSLTSSQRTWLELELQRWPRHAARGSLEEQFEVAIRHLLIAPVYYLFRHDMAARTSRATHHDSNDRH